MKPIIVDTSVLVDIFLETAARHPEAKKLGSFLVAKKVDIKLPMHGMFELACSLKNKKATGSYKLQSGITKDSPLRITRIPIDEKFFEEYFDINLPYLKAGDFIFIAMAKKDAAILITEDNKMFDRAKEAGIEVYKIKEFIDKQQQKK